MSTQMVRVVLDMTEHPVAIDAFPTPVPGLVIHRAVNQPGEWWAVTHADSGTAISSYLPSPEAALACVAALGQVADWTGALGQLRGNSPQVNAILARWGAAPAPGHQMKKYRDA